MKLKRIDNEYGDNVFEVNMAGQKTLVRRMEVPATDQPEPFVVWERLVEHSERPSVWKDVPKRENESTDLYDELERLYKQL